LKRLAHTLILCVAVLSQLLVSCYAQTSADSQKTNRRVITGAEHFLMTDFQLGRAAVVANQTSMVGETHLVDAL
jgi:hypothetical protein